MALKRPGYTPSDVVRARINVGAGFDIITGEWETGKHGESILNGGLSTVTGYVGQGNQYKSTIEEYQNQTAMIRVMSHPDVDSYCNLYDTETNKGRARIGYIIKYLQKLHDMPQFDFSDVSLEGDEKTAHLLKLEVTDASKHLADEWWSITRDWLLDKRKSKGDYVETPFIDRDGKSLFKIPTPTFGGVDSVSEFITSNVEETRDKAELGDSKGNMIFAQQGLQKKRFIGEVPALCQSAGHYMSLVAQFTQAIYFNPDDAKKPKVLQYMPQGMKIKGVPVDFTFLTHNCWYMHGTTLCINDTTKSPDYPRDAAENISKSKDLVEVKVQNWRGKSGQSGIIHTVIASQAQGVLPSLTELHLLRNTRENPKEGPRSKMYGLGGNDISKFTADLYPGKVYTRTTIRSELDNDYKLRRAVNIACEMAQMATYWQGMDDVLVVPSVLYEDLIKLGYDWDILLASRGWWTLENDSPKHQYPFLSTLDLLHMRLGRYHPFWLESDKKTIKKAYRKDK